MNDLVRPLASVGQNDDAADSGPPARGSASQRMAWADPEGDMHSGGGQPLPAVDERVRELIGALPAAIYTTDAEGRIELYNDAAARLWGRQPDPGQDQWCGSWRLYWPDGRPMQHDHCPMAIALKENRRIRGAEAIAERPDGIRVSFLAYPTPLHDASGALAGGINMLVDISERKEAERAQRRLLAELNHRVRNTLATVQALARQTLQCAGSPADFERSFSGRVEALSRVHMLLAQRNWQEVELGSLARELLLADDSGSGRIVCTGPRLLLEPATGLHLALVLHELNANARRHGALSRPEGRLSVSWSATAEGGLDLRWAEGGGPPVRPPANPGFGLLLIEKSIKGAEAGQVRLGFDSSGLVCEIRLPLPTPRGDAAVAAPPSKRPTEDGEPGQQDGGEKHELTGLRILVLEDEPLVSLDIVATLTAAGAEVVGPAASVARALELIARNSIDVALLDANLGGEPADAVADALAQRGIPFAFVTGYAAENLPEVHRSVPIVSKPYTPSRLVKTARDLVPAK